MTEARFPNLLSAISLGGTRLKNRIVSTGHHTYLADKEPSDELIAYHEERARGGAGLIISEIVAGHPSAAFSGQLLSALDTSTIDAYSRLAKACHRHGCPIFAQLFHPGREILSSYSGFAPLAYAPSAVPNERFHIMPKAMSVALIEEIIEGFALCAANLAAAGFDGIEIVGSHGYLPAQFLSPAVNRRDDEYGGDFERRLLFIRNTIASIRARAPTLTLGLRLSANDYEVDGVDESAAAEICVALQDDLDYFSLVAGSSATLGASVHVVPPMGVEAGYVAPLSQAIREKIDTPVIVTGRINQPQDAERIIARGQADLCGMTRALICDPQLPNKTIEGQHDDIRACIGCNQSCIGRAHKGIAISCIQNPSSGRELDLGVARSAECSKKLMVVGAGPAGMKFAVEAARRGHRVTLYERATSLGGQVLLAQRLPGREEFGGMVTNLARELDSAAVEVLPGREINLAEVQRLAPDAVILATGADVYWPQLEMLERDRAFSYEDVLCERATLGNSVIVADWRGDWIGLGIAEKLARDGCRVRLLVNGPLAGESLQVYTRNHYVGRLYRLGVEIIPHARLYGSDDGAVYFQNTLTEEAMIFEGVDSLVLSVGQRARNSLERELQAAGIESLSIGDCLLPRTAEEAIYEGMTAAWAI
ncbi:MAG: FAD-dependent oxidoreductase [Gammaproteobacteria bacterium]|nr:FAD-dependent oxidoreductase [Gammaproteobacteria bacterium]